MNEGTEGKSSKRAVTRVSKECAYLAVFVAVVIALQLALSAIPGVELVTLLFLSYAFVFGVRRGVLAAVAFTFLRLLIFGVYPTVIIVYLLYYPAFTLLFGWLGGRVKSPARALWWLTVLAVLGTVCFTVLDNIVTPLFYGMTKDAAKGYFIASLPLMLPQVVCTAVTVGALFLPLERAFRLIKRGLK